MQDLTEASCLAPRCEKAQMELAIVLHPPGNPTEEDQLMAMLKVIEVLAQSETSWEDAAQAAVAKAAKSLHNVRSIYIKDMEAKVENNKISEYRINAKISFEMD